MKKTALILGGLLVAYILSEVVFSGDRYLFPAVPQTYLIFDGIDRTVRFDPVTGFRLTTTPTRAAKIANGKAERISPFRGNHQGFSGRHDFYPQRPMSMGTAKPVSHNQLATARPARIAVLGDSLTAAWYFTGSWTDTVQEESEGELELLNFAQERTGLANWWRIVTQLIVPQGYQLDGVVFAIFGHDLHRRFTFYPQRGQAFELYGRCDTWNSESFPKSEAAARYESLSSKSAFNLSTEEFERALRGDWTPRVHGEFKLYLARNLRELLFPTASDMARTARDRDAKDPDREKLIQDIRGFLESQKLPAMVVYIPNRAELLHRDGKESTFDEARAFGSAIGAGVLVDGREAFAGLTAEEINANWLSHDFHWNQRGADRFAGFMRKKLSSWSKGRPQ